MPVSYQCRDPSIALFPQTRVCSGVASSTAQSRTGLAGTTRCGKAIGWYSCRQPCDASARLLARRPSSRLPPKIAAFHSHSRHRCRSSAGLDQGAPQPGRHELHVCGSQKQAHGQARREEQRRPSHPLSDADVEASLAGQDENQALEAGVIPESRLLVEDPTSSAAEASTSGRHAGGAASAAIADRLLYPPAQRTQIRDSWKHLMRWSKLFKRNGERGSSALDRVEKVVVFGGGSFGTAMGVALARQKADLQVTLLLRDPYVCQDINQQHVNTRYLKDYVLPLNVTATTCTAEAIQGAQYAIHAVPVQHSRPFLESIKGVLPPDVPIISVSKGLELGTGRMMSELIPQVLGRKQPAAFLSGPSFAKEVMDLQPTGVVAASKDPQLAREMQELFASPYMRVNHTSDVTGVEICGALKNVLAIAAGIVEGLDLGNNAMAALVTQGCAEIRWLAEKMGASPATVAGLSGLGDIMLTCYGALSRNRSVGVRLGRGERLDAILASSKQVAEGVSTAGVVVALARKYRVKLPVLTAVAHILNSDLAPRHAVAEIMNLPQIEER